MEVKFFGENGEVFMSGGGSAKIRITKISGIGVCTMERQLIKSYDFDGAKESARRAPQRLINISGDMRGSARDAAKLMRTLEKPCVMVISGGGIERRINISSADIEFGARSGDYFKFVISLTCDDPYFYDEQENIGGLFARTKLIDDKMTLPAVFSERTDGASVDVCGDREIEPIIEILGAMPQGSEGRIVIENLSAEKTFTINYVPAEGERITVDIGKRTITSDINGNILKYISDDSFMSDLVIGIGTSQLRAVGYGAAVGMSSYIRYRNKYIEAFV